MPAELRERFAGFCWLNQAGADQASKRYAAMRAAGHTPPASKPKANVGLPNAALVKGQENINNGCVQLETALGGNGADCRSKDARDAIDALNCIAGLMVVSDPIASQIFDPHGAVCDKIKEYAGEGIIGEARIKGLLFVNAVLGAVKDCALNTAEQIKLLTLEACSLT